MELGEADTRAKLIDPALHGPGRTEDLIRPEKTADAIEVIGGQPRRRPRDRVDHTLWVKVNAGTQPLAVALKPLGKPADILREAKSEDVRGMTYDPSRHHPRSIRLAGYDYSAPDAYFVTICVQDRQCLLGEIVEERMQANDGGQMGARWWAKLPNKFRTAQTDESIVMPNHFHGILVIVGATAPAIVGAALRGRPSGDRSGQTRELPSP